jgi:hypothetical protein
VAKSGDTAPAYRCAHAGYMLAQKAFGTAPEKVEDVE